jgi:exodeoxyribonuclease-5
MVGNIIGQDIAEFGTPVLALGDPAQLPPVRDGGYYTNCKPDLMLKEIHRQAECSPIIDLATKVRKGERLSIGAYGESNVIPKGRLTIEEIAAYNQIIVGKNVTRKSINKQIRKEVLHRETHLPEQGDLLICLKNNYDNGLLNGSQWIVLEARIIDDDFMVLEICNADDPDKYSFEVIAFRHHFEDRADAIAHYEMGDADHFDFGYAITCHKAQGSQWKDVCIVDESAVFNRNGSQDKWLYTAITRASEKVTVIQ